jgi:ribosomal RNA-processing protein 12
LSRTTIDELISTIEIFLNSPNREIAKTAIGFMKVAVISLPREVVLEQLDKMVPGLLKWANEHKNYFKSNIQSLLERLLRKFGFETLEKFVTTRDENDGGRKLVYSLKKKQKKKKLQQQPRGENDENEGESDGVSVFFCVSSGI